MMVFQKNKVKMSYVKENLTKLMKSEVKKERKSEIGIYLENKSRCF